MPPYLNSTLLDDPLLTERVESFVGGMRAFARGSLLHNHESQELLNVLLRTNHYAETRPGADALGAVQVEASRIQGAFYYDTPSLERLLVAVGQNLYYWNGSAWSGSLGHIPSSSSDMIEFAQGINNIYIADPGANVFSWDGSAYVDLGSGTGATGDPPTGATILLWHTNRMFASGQATNPDTIWASDILDAGANKWNHTTNSFRVGAGEGEPIIGLARGQDAWMAVFKEGSIVMVYADPQLSSATDWNHHHLTTDVALVGKRAWTQHENDIWFMAHDGVRKLSRMPSAAGLYEVTPPLSEPLQPWIDRINRAAQNTIVAQSFGQHVLFAVPIDSATQPDHVLAYNGRIGRWMGVWTGWTPTVMVTTRFSGKEELIIGDTTGRLNKWKQADDDDQAATFQDNSTDYATSIKSKVFQFNERESFKDLFRAEIKFFGSQAQVEIQFHLDGAQSMMFPHDTQEIVNQLPVDLPFDLATSQPSRFRRTFSAKRFQDLEVLIKSSSGKLKLQNISLQAFLDSIVLEC